MAIDQQINDLVELYERAMTAPRIRDGDSPMPSRELAEIGVGMENAVLAAIEAEAAMLRSISMERMAVARAKALGAV